MRHKIRQIMIDAINNTFFESSARKMYELFSNTQGSKYDQQTRLIMEKTLKIDSNCIDVGSYRGEILRDMVRFSPQGDIYAFEPTRQNYQYLKKKFPRVNIYNIAVSNESGQSVFYNVVGRTGRNGLRKRNYPDTNQKVEEIIIETDTLDNVIPENVKVDFIKIDVEGAEYLVLQGAIKLLKKYSPTVIFEHGKSAKVFGVTASRIYDFFNKDMDLQVSSMERWLGGKNSFARDEFIEITDLEKEFCFISYPSA